MWAITVYQKPMIGTRKLTVSKNGRWWRTTKILQTVVLTSWIIVITMIGINSIKFDFDVFKVLQFYIWQRIRQQKTEYTILIPMFFFHFEPLKSFRVNDEIDNVNQNGQSVTHSLYYWVRHKKNPIRSITLPILMLDQVLNSVIQNFIAWLFCYHDNVFRVTVLNYY